MNMAAMIAVVIIFVRWLNLLFFFLKRYHATNAGIPTYQNFRIIKIITIHPTTLPTFFQFTVLVVFSAELGCTTDVFGKGCLQCLQTTASSCMSSAQKGHFFIGLF